MLEKCFSSKLPNRDTILTVLFAVFSAILIGLAGYYDKLNLDWVPSKIFFVAGFVFLAIFFAIYILTHSINSKERSQATLFILSTIEIVLLASATAMATSLTIKHIEFAVFFVPLIVVLFTTLPTLGKIKLPIPGYINVVANVIKWLLVLSSFIAAFAITDIILADEDKVAIVMLTKEIPYEPYFDTSLAMIFIGGLGMSIILLAIANSFLSFASSIEKKDCKGVSLFFFAVGMIFFILDIALVIFLLYKLIAFDATLAVLLVGVALLNKN
jgi:hypothetical protein